MKQSPSWKANRSSASQEVRILWKRNVHYRIHNSSQPVPILIRLKAGTAQWIHQLIATVYRRMCTCAHTQTHTHRQTQRQTHNHYDSSERVISSWHWPLSTQHTTNTKDEHCGIRTRNLSNQAAWDSCLRPCSHRNRPVYTPTSFNSTAKDMTFVCVCVMKKKEFYVCQSIYVTDIAANFCFLQSLYGVRTYCCRIINKPLLGRCRTKQCNSLTSHY